MSVLLFLFAAYLILLAWHEPDCYLVAGRFAVAVMLVIGGIWWLP